MCLPETTDEVRADASRSRTVIATGFRSSLAVRAPASPGARSRSMAPIIIATSKMTRRSSTSTRSTALAWVQPGVLNLDLSNRMAVHGLHFAPDPSSQQTCSIGGNVANNSGGPHCLAEGCDERAHPRREGRACPTAPSPSSAVRNPRRTGYDLRGVFVGSEGMLGIATEVCVRLTQNYPDVRTLLMDFDRVEDGAATVSSIIAAGIVPAAIEMMDRLCLEAVEAFIHAGLPVESAGSAVGRGRRPAPRAGRSGRPG